MREAREEAEPVQEDEVVDEAGRLLFEERLPLDQSLRLRDESRMGRQLALEEEDVEAEQVVEALRAAPALLIAAQPTRTPA